MRLLSANIVIYLRLLVLLWLSPLFHIIFGPRLFLLPLIWLIFNLLRPSLQGGIPFEHLCGKALDYSNLCLFSSVRYVLLTPCERTKLTTQSIEYVFLSYKVEHKGYHCWDPVACRMRTSQNVVFDAPLLFYPRLLGCFSCIFVWPFIFHTFRWCSSRSSAYSSLDLPFSVSSSESPFVVPGYTVKPPVTVLHPSLEHAC
jgi:hypothetical protein